MTSIVDRRKNKFNRYKDLRENPTELLEPLIKPVKEYDVEDRIRLLVLGMVLRVNVVLIVALPTKDGPEIDKLTVMVFVPSGS